MTTRLKYTKNHTHQRNEVLPKSKKLQRPRTSLKQVLEVRVFLVRHIPQAVLAVDLGARLVEIAAHRVVDHGAREAQRLALVRLALLHPHDVEDLGYDDAPEDDPDDQDAFERGDLGGGRNVRRLVSPTHRIVQKREMGNGNLRIAVRIWN